VIHRTKNRRRLRFTWKWRNQS